MLFRSIGAESTQDNRRDYRHMLFTTPNAAKYISGVILFDETIRQNAADGTSLVKVLVSAATKFLNGRKVVPDPVLRKESVWDAMARDVLKARGLKSPIGAVKEQPASAYKE